jgi:hypothetical protein
MTLSKNKTTPSRAEMLEHIRDLCEEKAYEDGLYAIAFALLKVADAQSSLATQVSNLGTGNATTSMGAIEFLTTHIGEKLDNLTSANRRRGSAGCAP